MKMSSQKEYHRPMLSTSFGAEERIPSKFLVDPVAAIPMLRSDWVAYQETGALGDNVRPVIAGSWDRAREQHVSPDRLAADVDRAALRGFEPRDHARRLFLQASRPIVDQLATELGGSDSAIVMCDTYGTIIDRAGDGSILRRTEAQNFVPAAVWNEECAGTNGIGLCIALGRPAQVFAAEHYCVGFQSYACTAAPIRHPVTREMLGILDVTTDARTANFHTYAMVVHAARDIEQNMEEHVFGRERELLERYLRGRVGLEVPFLTVDRSGRTIIQNAQAAQHLTNEDLPCVLRVVQEALRRGVDVTDDLDLSLGLAKIHVHLVRGHGDVLGALVAIDPESKRQRHVSANREVSWHPLVGRSPAMKELLRRAGRVAESPVPVVIEGEAGTGKLTLARAMHARSPLAASPFTAITCSATRWRQAWSRARVEAGTVVFRHLAALDDLAQLELAAALEERTCDGESVVWPIGIVTSGDPPLRLELLHRLGQIRLTVPPLRERGGDVELIVFDWCRRIGRSNSPAPVVTPASLEALSAHDWPGNVRELLNALASAKLQHRGAAISPSDLDLPDGLGYARSTATTELRDVERDAIELALRRTGGNVSRAAEILGISRSTLHRRLRSYRLVGH
jgi:sigma-54 dependent transcriptional regulator, acetoin dehydrogenase operon transcriptional activator AcoR